MAPALKVFGRRWHPATDDLPLPAIFGSIVHVLFTALCAAALAGLELAEGEESTCPAKVRYRGMYATLVSIDVIMAVLLALLARASLRGSILDAHLRKDVDTLVHIVSFAYLLLAGATVYANVVHHNYSQDACYRFTSTVSWNPQLFSLAAVLCHWSMLGVFAFIVSLAHNPFQELSSVGSWEQRCICLGYCLCCARPQMPRMRLNLNVGHPFSPSFNFSSHFAALTSGRFGSGRSRVEGETEGLGLGRASSHEKAPGAAPGPSMNITVRPQGHGSLDLGRGNEGQASSDTEQSQTLSNDSSPLAALLPQPADPAAEAGATGSGAVAAASAPKSAPAVAAGPAGAGAAAQAVSARSSAAPSLLGKMARKAAKVSPGEAQAGDMEAQQTTYGTAAGGEGYGATAAAGAQGGKARLSGSGGGGGAVSAGTRSVAGSEMSGMSEMSDANRDLIEEVQELEAAEHLSPLMRLAAVFSYFYSHVDLTFSDIATAFLLVGIKQSIERREAAMEEAACASSGFAAQPASAAAGSQARDLGAVGKEKRPERTEGEEGEEAVAEAAEEEEDSATVPDESLSDCYHYFRYACAAYGWPMYLWMHRARQPTRCCGLCVRGCCRCGRRRAKLHDDPSLTSQPAENLTVEAIRRMTAMVPQRHLLYVNKENKVAGLLPYFIALDEERREVILAVRGSMSQYDAVTDLVCEPVQLGYGWLAGRPVGVGRTDSKGPGGALSGAFSGALSSPRPQDMPRRAVPQERDAQQPISLESVAVAVAAGAGAAEAGASGAGAAAHGGAEHGEGEKHRHGHGSSRLGKSSRHAGHSSSRNAGTGAWAHRGMYSAARAIIADIEQRGLLRAALCADQESQLLRDHPLFGGAASASAPKPGQGQPPDQQQPGEERGQREAAKPWGLIVTGHSLGAGTAALLSLHLRAAYPQANVRCWAYAPPGGLVSPDLATAMRPYCTSVVVGRDLVPRLSFSCMDRLNRDMLVAAACCKVPKAAFWARLLGCKRWRRHELFRDWADVPQEAKALVEAYSEGVSSSSSSHRFQPAYLFTAPGRVLFFERHSGAGPAGPAAGKAGATGQGGAAAGPAASGAATGASPSHVAISVAAGDVAAATSQGQAHAQGQGAASPTLFERDPHNRFRPRWISAAKLRDRGLEVSRRMFIMHLPDFQMDVVQACLRERGVPMSADFDVE